MVVKYSFYKNIIICLPPFYFGFQSLFAAENLYEPLLFQWYNIFFTSLPIMYFALYDWEHDKSTFLEEPKLYNKGMKYSEYNSKVIFQWILMASLHGFIAYACVFWVL